VLAGDGPSFGLRNGGNPRARKRHPRGSGHTRSVLKTNAPMRQKTKPSWAPGPRRISLARRWNLGSPGDGQRADVVGPREKGLLNGFGTSAMRGQVRRRFGDGGLMTGFRLEGSHQLTKIGQGKGDLTFPPRLRRKRHVVGQLAGVQPLQAPLSPRMGLGRSTSRPGDRLGVQAAHLWPTNFHRYGRGGQAVPEKRPQSRGRLGCRPLLPQGAAVWWRARSSPCSKKGAALQNSGNTVTRTEANSVVGNEGKGGAEPKGVLGRARRLRPPCQPRSYKPTMTSRSHSGGARSKCHGLI